MNWQNLLSLQTLSRLAGAVAVVIGVIRASAMHDLLGGIVWLIVGAALLAWPTLSRSAGSDKS
jgi:hypothetical protein